MTTKTVPQVADLRFNNFGSVSMIEALTEAGREWLQEFTQSEPWQWMGGMLAIEPRCADDIREGAIDAGLEVL